MPTWNQVLEELQSTGSNFDVVRRKYLKSLSEITGRNVIAYYSGWLQKQDVFPPGFGGFAVDDADKSGFMATIHQLDRSKGLDLILHTPGGSVAATESLVDYLRTMFDGDIRAIVPQIAMSAGTMIALACKSVIMGKHSSLGPIDPQIGGIAAHGVIEEFNNARREMIANPATIPLWQPIIAKYNPTLIGECQKAIDWSEQIVKDWLITGMFASKRTAEAKAIRIINELGSHSLTLSHSRHVSAVQAKKLGINIVYLESDQRLQDAVLTVHHTFIHSLQGSSSFKMIENQNGTAHVLSAAIQSRIM